MWNSRYTLVAYPDSTEYYAIWDHEENDYVRGESSFALGGFTEAEGDEFIAHLLRIERPAGALYGS